MKNQKILKMAISIIFAMSIILFTVFVMAGDSTKILVDVKDFGKDHANEAESSVIQRQILKDESSSNELVIESKIKNNGLTKTEIAVLVDDSSSMLYNSNSFDIKAEVEKFITGAFDYNISNMKMNVSTNTATTSMTNNKSVAIGYANNLSLADDTILLSSGLEKAYNSFSNEADIRKCMVIFTDATDVVKQKLAEYNTNNNVEIASILIDLNSDQFVNTDGSNATGTVLDINSDGTTISDYTEIYDSLKGTFKNVVIEDRFSEKTIKYFDFEVLSEYDDIVKKVVENGKIVGYTAEFDKIEVQQERKIKYKLKVKSDINSLIEEADINGAEINLNDKIVATYDYNSEQKKNEMIYSPKIQMIKTTSVTIIAVNEYAEDMMVSGIEFNVIAMDKVTKEIIINETKTTGFAGKIVCENISTTNPIEFLITPNVNKEGYDKTSATKFLLEYNSTTKGRVINSKDVKWNEEANKSNINIIYPIKLKKFELEVNLNDISNNSIKLGNIDFKLIQPKLNNQMEMDVLDGTTNSDGKIIFKPTVMTKDGYYDYILSQENEFNGYYSMGMAKIRVSFKNGKVENVEIKENENVKENENKRKEDFISIEVGNNSIADEKFNLKIKLTDKDTGAEIQGTSYKVVVIADGKTVEYGPVETNELGEVNIPIAGNGNIQFTITEIQSNIAYISDKVDKTFSIKRNSGKLEANFITKPLDIKGTIDTKNNIIEVNLESRQKTEQNVVRIQAVDIDEQDINIAGLNVELRRNTDGKVLYGKTNSEGMVDIVLPDEFEGDYTYTLHIPNPPLGYLPINDQTIQLSYDMDKKIDTTKIVNISTPPFISVEALKEDATVTKKIGANMKLGFNLDPVNDYSFGIRLVGSDSGNAIEGAKYNIKITTTLASGDTVERNLINRITDLNGELDTKLVLGPNIKIEIQQTYTNTARDANGNPVGYKIDESIQTIQLGYDGTQLRLLNETPHNQAEGQGMGTNIELNRAVFLHKNDPRTTNDTFLNLHITKRDEFGAYIEGMGIKIYTNEAQSVNQNDEPMGLMNITSGTPVSLHDNPIYAQTDSEGKVDLERLIQVLGIIKELHAEQAYSFVAKEYDVMTGLEVDGSETEYRIVYRYNQYTNQVEFTNIDIISGKRLELESPKYTEENTGYGYETDVYLLQGSYYAMSGNFGIDFEKCDINDNKKLLGAEYDITVIRPDGSVINYKNKKINDLVELGGFYVTTGTTIEIKEVVAPVGYEINEAVEVIEITDVAKDGTVTYTLKEANYKISRMEKISETKKVLADGTYRTILGIRLKDRELDTFKFGIIAKDKETRKPVEGYSFNIVNSKNAEKNTNPTNSLGETNVLIGGYYTDTTPITYIISTNKTAQYYKELDSEINLQVYFDENGEVDELKTRANQTDPEYNKTWKIKYVNNPGGNSIDIEIIVTPYDKLKVEIETVDKITGDVLTNITYTIPESINIVASGTTSLEVGYVNPGSISTYTLLASNAEPKYLNLKDHEIQIEYDKDTGDIINTPTVKGSNLEYISHTGKTIYLKVTLEPKTKFTLEIETVDKLTNAVLTNINYVIPESPDIRASGTTTLEVGYIRRNTTENLFTIKTENLGPEYVQPENQQFTVDIEESTGNIINPVILGSDLEYITHHDKYLKVRLHIEPRIIFTVEIESIDAITGQKVEGIEYLISESPNLPAKGKSNSLGIASINVGYVNINTTDDPKTYIISTENNDSAKYKYNLNEAQEIKIGIDDQGNIGNYEILTKNLQYVSHNERTIKLRIQVEPKMVFVISNKAHTTNTPLQGGTFEVKNLETEEVSSQTTNASGNATIYNGKYYQGNDTQTRQVIYLVKQTVAKLKFARIEDFYVAVYYNEERKIVNANLCDINGNTIPNSSNLWVNVSHSVPADGALGYNGNDNGVVNIEILNYPSLRIHFENTDRRDDSIKLENSVFDITSSNSTNASVTTDANGEGIAYIDGVSVGKYTYYTVKQAKAALKTYNPGTQQEGKPDKIMYQLIEDFYIKAYFDENGYVDSVYLVDAPNDEGQRINVNYINVSDIEKSERTTIEDELLINVKVRSNPPLQVTINKKGTTGIPINGVIFTLVNREIGSTKDISRATGLKTGFIYHAFHEDYGKYHDELIERGIRGQSTLYMQKTLVNKTMEFELTERTEKFENPLGYKKLTEQIKFEIEFDNDGKIIPETIRITSGSKYINFSKIDKEGFKITIEFVNDEIEEFGIHLTTTDTYDANKKVESTNGLRADVIAFINDSRHGIRDYGIQGSLISGRDSNSDGIPDVDYGEDYQLFGKVIPSYTNIGDQYDGGTRTIRFTFRNAPNKYYEGKKSIDSYYQSITRKIEVVVHFDSEGKITSAYYKTGKIRGEWYVDSRYISISHTAYNLEVNLKFFPMLQVGINAVDEYTKEHLAGGQFHISTYAYYPYSKYYWNANFYGGISYYQMYNKAGYIGNTSGYYPYPSYSNTATTITADLPNRYTLGPTEISSNAMRLENGVAVRRFYIYETKEPTSPMQYQQYEPRYNTGSYYWYNKLLGFVDVYYNECGEIIKYDTKVSAGRSIDDNNTPDGTYYIKVSENQHDSKHAISIDIEYKPTTRLKLYLVDEVTKAGLSGVKVYPFLGGTNTTSRSYQYRGISYYMTGGNGLADVTYWGGNTADGNNVYEIDSYYMGGTYSEYFSPGRVSINVSYDSNGRIKSAVPASRDTFGDYNAQIVKFQGNTVEVYILCSRKFQMRLNKLDNYDTTKALSATFRLTAPDGTEITVGSNSRFTFGKIRPGQTLEYIISEIGVPVGYLPVDNFKLSIKFNTDGTVISTADSPQYEQIYGGKPVAVQYSNTHYDLLANIYDKPSFTLKLQLSDEYYPSIKLKGGVFTITNDKGDSAQGTCITNGNGYFETYVGESYPGETVRYTINQENVLPGYNPNNNVAVLKITFGNDGNIASYEIEEPKPYNYNVVNSTQFNYLGKKYIQVDVTNMPRDVKIGITKYDELTNQRLEGIQFKVTKHTGTTYVDEKIMTTNEQGTNIQVIDEFQKREERLRVTYTISEIVIPNTYRKIQDTVFEVTYNKDGRIDNYKVISNPSNVKVEVAVASQIRYTDNEPVHIALTIPNDNAFDLIVKDEDKNYSGLGIEGTEYDVSINGKELNKISTDVKGYVQYLNITENGIINIRVAENTVGEGYRQNLKNDISFNLEKGETEYSLKLQTSSLIANGYIISNTMVDTTTGNITYDIIIDQVTNTTATIIVNETTGQVTVIFKNETKLELTLTKNDINTGRLLKDAQFEITSQIISPTLEPVETITTAGVDDITDINGRIYFDLGVAPQNKVVKYTFKEITPPIKEDGTPYGVINDIEVTVEFDMYGKINPRTSIKDNSQRCEAYMSSYTGNSRDIRVLIGNGALKKAFTIKIISEDSVTGEGINDSIFRIDAQEVTSGKIALNDQIIKTGVQQDPSGIVQQEGIYINKNVGTQNEGDIIINIQQEECADGYIFGNNIIAGTIVINKQNIEGDSLDAAVQLALGNITGFDINDVQLDIQNNELRVIVRNDPVTSINIDKFYKKLRTEEKTSLKDAEFTLIVDVDGEIETIEYNENGDKLLTNSEGKLKINLGEPKYNKTVTYTLKETTMIDFEELEDIVFKVKYDISGRIVSYEVITNNEHAKIKETEKLSKPVYKINESGQKVIDSMDNIEVSTVGRRTIPLIVENDKISEPLQYKIILEKYNEAELIDENGNMMTPNEANSAGKIGGLLEGARYKIKVTEENGIEYEWVQTTNKDGKIESRNFEGFGKIKVEITELEAPIGFALDNRTKVINFTRDEKTGTLVMGKGTVDCEFNEEFTEVYIRPINTPNNFSLYMYKTDAETGQRITDNSAKFEIYIDANENIYQIGKGEIDANGELKITEMEEPDESGTYEMYIREIKAPKDYIKIEDDIKINVTFIKNGQGELEISNVSTDNKMIMSTRHGGKYVFANLANYMNKETPEESYNIIIEKHSEVPDDTELLTGAKYEIKVYEDYNDAIELTEVTNKEGIIETDRFHGFGLIRVELTEIEAPTGYLIDSETKYVEFRKSEETGKLERVDSNVDYEFSADGMSSVIIKPINEFSNYAIYINKVDLDTEYRIQKNPARFELYMDSPDEGAIIKLAEGDTKDNGQLKVDTLKFPEKPGEYTYYIKETKAPTGYVENDETIELKMKFKMNKLGNMYIAGASTNSEKLKILLVANKYLKINISNDKLDSILDYNFILEKHTMIDGDNTLIEGATFKIKVDQQFGNDDEWIDTTNEDGKIISQTFNGYGNIRVDIVELTSPSGFKINNSEQFIEFRKDKETGLLTKDEGNIDFSFSEDSKTTVILKPRDELDDGVLALYVNKIDLKTRKNITNNPATFELYMKDENDMYTYLDKFSTLSSGTVRIIRDSMPDTPGIYTYLLKETQAPFGYKLPEEGYEFNIEYDLNDDGNMYVKNVYTIDKQLELNKYGDQFIVFDCLNKKAIEESEFYSLEINKVDSETLEPIIIEDSTDEKITNKAIFKVTDDEGNVYYAESDENGKIIFEELIKPEKIPIGQEYVDRYLTIKEIMAPNGYKLQRGETQLNIRFFEDPVYGIVIDQTYISIEYGGDNVDEINLAENAMSLLFKNEKGDPTEADIDRGRYSIILTKVEKETKELLPKEAEFNIALENGQKVKTSVKNSAKIEILEIKAPVFAGEYEYVIQETEAPKGYVLNNDSQILKIQFEDDPNDISKLVITNAVAITNLAGETALDVTSFADNTVEVNFENQLDDKLYLQSKQDDAGEDIYNVFQEDDVPYVSFNHAGAQKIGKTYTFNKPTIYTKKPLEKVTLTKYGISIEEFINNLDTNAEKLTVYDEDGTEAAIIEMDGTGNITSLTILKNTKTSHLIKTGQTIKAIRGIQELTYDVIVKGDLNGDGMITTADSTFIKQILAHSLNYGDREKAAGDVETEGIVATADSTLIKQIIGGIK